jgi:hypothetical protein
MNERAGNQKSITIPFRVDKDKILARPQENTTGEYGTENFVDVRIAEQGAYYGNENSQSTRA